MTPDATWRASQADGLDELAAVIAAALDHLDNVEAVLEHRRRDELLTELRSFAGGLRAEQAAMTSEASAVRAPPATPAMPMALTTRYPRRRPVAADHEEGTDDGRALRTAGAAAGDDKG